MCGSVSSCGFTSFCAKSIFKTDLNVAFGTLLFYELSLVASPAYWNLKCTVKEFSYYCF